jgi:CheY-like chemotaxis protein
MSKDIFEDSSYSPFPIEEFLSIPSPGDGLHRVLHIDSDEDAALVLATLLVPAAHVTRAHSIGEAASYIAQEAFSLVVLDPDLPDGDGLQLLESLAVIMPETPVLLYTARQVAHGATVHAYLPKPWTSPRQLFRSMSELLTLSCATSSGPLS